MNNKTIVVVLILLSMSLAVGCRNIETEPGTPCSRRQALFCEDFESVDPQLGGSDLVTSSAVDQWWVSSDEDLSYLFQDFPLAGRSRNNLILLSSGTYKDLSGALLYTREIDLTSASRATLSFNLIYLTEKHWDGLVVFAVQGGIDGTKDPQNWVMLTPEGGYPGSVYLNGSLVPGYSGINNRWTSPEFDLSSFIGQKLILGFYFSSDDYLGNWGVGLDDIVVTADNGQVAKSMAGLTENPINEIMIIRDPLISPELPRANPLEDIACVSFEEDLLEESQRAIVKAISESGERVLVLHPQRGTFCWVDQDKIWIDGDTARVPVLLEKSRNTYFPVSSYSRTPVSSDPSCDSPSNDDLPLYLQTAWIQNGKISSLLFEPLLPGQEGSIPVDPRTSNPDLFMNLDPGINPGGQIEVDIGGSTFPCSADWNHPGVVICQGLSLDPKDSLNLEICWIGWDETQACPLGYYYNSLYAICVPIDGSNRCELDCGKGQIFSEQLKRCRIDENNNSLVEDLDSCLPGTLADFSSKQCIGTEYDLDTNCPPGLFYSVETSSCRTLGENGVCPQGYQPLAGKESCIPEEFKAPPLCRSLEINFPVSEVIVKETTRCLNGPSKSSEVVSSLKAFDAVEVIGVGEGGEWLVVFNTDYQIPCWAPLLDFYFENLDTSILPIILPD